MTRFINNKVQQSISQPSFPFIHYLLLALIILEFIPLPNLPAIQIKPIYLLAWVSVLVMAFNFNKLSNLSPVIIKIIFLLLFYGIYSYLLAWSLDMLAEKHADNTPGPTIRKCIELLLFAVACTNLVELKRVLFTISTTILISTVVGLLIHHVGEPFQSIRDWLLQSQMRLILKNTGEIDVLPGEGYRVMGLSGTHWAFGYLMSAGPAISLICGRLSSFKWLWMLIFFIFSYALYQNGERAALLGACFAVVSLLIIWRLVSIPYICIGLALVLSIYIFKPGLENQQKFNNLDENLTSRMVSSSVDKDVDFRLSLWKAGIFSVIKHPFTGPTREEYLAELFGEDDLIVASNPDRRRVPSHNAYIYTGLQIGLLGWLLMLYYLAILKNIITKVFTAKIANREEKIIFEGVSVVTLAPMINSIFQNEGIFNEEPTVLCLTGLLISSYQILYNRNRYQTLTTEQNIQKSF